MKKILFLYHIREREYTICELLKDAIMEKNPNSNVLISNFDMEYQVAFSFKPDIIITIPPRAKWASDILTLIKMTINPIIISMTTEGLFEFKENKIQLMVGYNDYHEKLVDYYLFWGPETAKVMGNELIKQNKVSSIDRIKYFGYVMYELDMVKKKAKKLPINKKITDISSNYRKSILWVTGFMAADDSIDDLIKMGAFLHKDEESYKEELHTAKLQIDFSSKYRKKYIEYIKRNAEINKDILFIVKLHPTEFSDPQYRDNSLYDFSMHDNIYVVNESVPIGVLLPYVSLMIHYGSTTGLEAYIYKVPTVQLTKNEDEYPVTNYGRVFYPSTECINIDNESEIAEIIKKDLKYKNIEEMNNFLADRFNYCIDEKYNPSEMLADLLETELKMQSITKKEPKVKHLLNEMTAFSVREYLYKKILTSLLQLNISNVMLYFTYVYKILPKIHYFFRDIYVEFTKRE